MAIIGVTTKGPLAASVKMVKPDKSNPKRAIALWINSTSLVGLAIPAFFSVVIAADLSITATFPKSFSLPA
jgi:hypothetical protein